MVGGDYLHNLAPRTFPLLTNITTAASVTTKDDAGGDGGKNTVGDALRDLLNPLSGGKRERSSILTTADYMRAASLDILRCHDKRIPSILRDLYKNALKERNRQVCIEMSAVFNLYVRSLNRLNFYKNAIQLGTGMMASTTTKFVPLDRGVRSVSITMNDVFNDMQWNDVSIERVAMQTCESPYLRLFRSIFLEALMEYVGRDSKLFKDEPDCEPTDVEIVNSYIDVFMQQTPEKDEGPFPPTSTTVASTSIDFGDDAKTANGDNLRDDDNDGDNLRDYDNDGDNLRDDDNDGDNLREDDNISDTILSNRIIEPKFIEKSNDESTTDTNKRATISPIAENLDAEATVVNVTSPTINLPLRDGLATDTAKVSIAATVNVDEEDEPGRSGTDDMDEFMRLIDELSEDEDKRNKVELKVNRKIDNGGGDETAPITTLSKSLATNLKRRKKRRVDYNLDDDDIVARGRDGRKRHRRVENIELANNETNDDRIVRFDVSSDSDREKIRNDEHDFRNVARW